MDIFPWPDLIDEIRPLVLHHLSVKQLVAIECIRTQMQRDVRDELCRVTKLVILNDDKRWCDEFCTIKAHQFHKVDAVKMEPMC